MIRIELPALLGRLNDICRHALEEAAGLCIQQRSREVTVGHLLFQLACIPSCDVRLILGRGAVDVENFKAALSAQFELRADHDSPEPQYPSFSPLLIELLQEAWLLGSLELDSHRLRGGAVMLCAVLNAGKYLPSSVVRRFGSIEQEALRRDFARVLADSVETEPVSGEIPATVDRAQGAGDSCLAKYGTEYTRTAREGGIDPVLGRDNEIDLMIDILSRRRKNNPIIVGDAGVGKSALVEGLALRIAQGRVSTGLRDVQLWGLDLGALQAGASVKGEFERRLKAILDEVKHAPKPIVLFIDEAHVLIGAGNSAGGSDAANLLKPALARGEVRTIAATTWSEYKKYFERDPALSRRFQLVKLTEPTIDQTTHMLRGLRPVYERAHGVHISDAALRAAASLSARYLTGRQLPDKAIDVLDTASARVASTQTGEPRRLAVVDNEVAEIDQEVVLLRRDDSIGYSADEARLAELGRRRDWLIGERERLLAAWGEQKAVVKRIAEARAARAGSAPHDGIAPAASLSELTDELARTQQGGALLHIDVGAEQIAEVIADWTGIPVSSMTTDQFARLEQLPALLQHDVKGQDVAIGHIHRHLLTAMADLRRPGTPLGAFLLVGPSGVGKTETALRVADQLFGGRRFLTVINLSEYQEKHTVSRLIGAPPGYVGYGEGGVLTEAIRQKPYSVVVLDEVEKAHPEVLNVFYQAFDKGELNDGEGRLIDCRNVLFFLTSNIGFDDAGGRLNAIPESELRLRLSRFFKPALLARMQVVQYAALDDGTLALIVDQRLERLQAQFLTRYGAALQVREPVREVLKARCGPHANGARMLDASIHGEVVPPLSLAVLKRMASAEPIRDVVLDFVDGQFVALLQ